MPLLDIQQAQREIGRIRTGISVKGRNDKQRPEKLTRFLITSDARSVVEAAAQVYGGKVDPYHPMGKEQKGWQVLIEAEEIPVAVPPGQSVVSQWWELWVGGGLTRRCDGQQATVWSKENGEQHGACVCPAEKADRAAAAASGRACKPSTTLCVMLPDIPGLGQFRLVSHGIYAAMEIGATAQLMQAAFDHGIVLPAVLRLSQREGVRRPGQVVNQFAVPELHLLHSLRQLEELAAAPAGQRVALPPPPVRAITAGTATAPPPEPAPAPRPAPAAAPGDDVIDAELVDDDQPRPAPAEGGMTARDVAEKARAARSRPIVDALGRHAAEHGLLEELVDDGSGAPRPLQDVLHDRLDALQATA